MLQLRVTLVRLLILAFFVSALAVPVCLPADVKSQIMVSEVIEPFDKPTYSWQVFPSKFGIDQDGRSLWEIRYVDSWPDRLFGRNPKESGLKCLGVHGGFIRKGYNFVEIVPGQGQGNDFKPAPIKLPGRVQKLDLWVWGSNFNYYIEAHVRDYRGIDHVLPLGSMQYAGWSNLEAYIPSHIPQRDQHVRLTHGLELTKLVVWTRPDEVVDDFYTYLDQLQVVTDKFEARFDGDDLADTDRVQEIWGAKK